MRRFALVFAPCLPLAVSVADTSNRLGPVAPYLVRLAARLRCGSPTFGALGAASAEFAASDDLYAPFRSERHRDHRPGTALAPELRAELCVEIEPWIVAFHDPTSEKLPRRWTQLFTATRERDIDSSAEIGAVDAVVRLRCSEQMARRGMNDGNWGGGRQAARRQEKRS